MYCLNGGESYYLIDEDTVGGNCTQLLEKNVVKKICS